MGSKSASFGVHSVTTVIFLLVLVLLSSVPAVRSAPVLEELHQTLFNSTTYPQYHASLRPLPDSAGNPVLVEIDAVLISVGPVNVLDMTWTLSCFFRQEWTDPRLVLVRNESSPTAPLNSSSTSSSAGQQSLPNVQLGHGEEGRIWVPDTYFSNSKVDRKHVITVPNMLIYISPETGHVLYSQRLTVELNCKMDLRKFPHDTQKCEFVIESYTYNTDNVVLKWSSSRSATTVQPTAFIPDFVVKSIEALDCTATYDIGTYPCLKAVVTLERQLAYYLAQNYAPTILIVVLSWASFWIDHQAVPARISVGLLTVLTITTQLSGTRAQLPKVPYVKAIDVWMSACLVFVFAAYMEYAVVTVLSRRYRKNLAGRRVRSIFKMVMEKSRSNISQPTFRSIVDAATARAKNTEDDDREGTEERPASASSAAAAGAEVKETASNGTRCRSPPSSSLGPVEAGVLRATSKYRLYRAEDQTPEQPPEESTSKKTLPDSGSRPGMDTGRMVDQLSRLLFPITFGVFNVVYWVYYTYS